MLAVPSKAVSNTKSNTLLRCCHGLIAAVLRRAPSSISREIRRNTIAVATVPYDAAPAGATPRRRRCTTAPRGHSQSAGGPAAPSAARLHRQRAVGLQTGALATAPGVLQVVGQRGARRRHGQGGRMHRFLSSSLRWTRRMRATRARRACEAFYRQTACGSHPPLVEWTVAVVDVLACLGVSGRRAGRKNARPGAVGPASGSARACTAGPARPPWLSGYR